MSTKRARKPTGLKRREFLAVLGSGVALALHSAFSVRSQTLTPVRIGLVPGNISFADVLLAQQQGFFAEEGLEVALVAGLNGALVHNALVGGAVDFVPLAGGYVPFVRPAGIRTRQVAARTELNGFSLVVRKDLEDSVKTVQDLRGRRIVVEALGSTITWAMAVNYLTRAGLDFERDVQLIATNSQAAELAALISGQADAAVLDGPADEQLVSSGEAFRLIDPLDPVQHLLWVGNAREDALAWITREEVIAQSPQVVQALVNAAAKSLSFLQQQHERGNLTEVALALRSDFPDLDTAVLQRSLERFARTLAPEASLSWTAYYADLIKWVSLKLVQPLPFEEAVAGQFSGTRP